MRHDNGGAPAHQHVQRSLHGSLVLGVQRRGGFVEQEDGRVLQDGAGDGEPLALAS